MRTGSTYRVLGLLLGPLVVLSLASLSPSAAFATAQPGFRPGESFIFNFSVGAIQAGRARLAVGMPKQTIHGPRVAINGDAETSPWLKLLAHVKDSYKSQLEAAGLPYTRRVQMEEHGLRERTIDFVLDRLGNGTRLMLDIVKPDQTRKEVHDLVGKPLDLVGSLFFIRFQPMAMGDRFEFVFFDGPLFYRAHATVIGHEQLTWSGGPASALQLDINAERIDWNFNTVVGPGAQKRHARLLLSDDADHIPYRIEGETDVGLCQLELVAYLPGGAPVVLAPAPASPAVPVSTAGTATRLVQRPSLSPVH